MEPNLRPLSLGEILDRTAQLYRENFILFAGISAVYAGAILALNLLHLGLGEVLRSLHMGNQLPWITLLFVLVEFPLMMVLAGASVAANNRAVAWVHLGQTATIRGAYRSILPRLGRYLWLMALVALAVYTPFLILFGGYLLLAIVYLIPKGVLANAGTHANPQATLVFGAATLAVVLLSIPALVYAVIMGLRYSLAVPAAVVEDLKARPALRRSIELSKGARGRIFVLGLLIAAIQIGLVGITQAFFVAATVKMHGRLPAWALVLQQFVGFLTNSFVGPMYATGFALFYYDQRIRKEGYDIEWMMQSAGLTVPEPPAEAPESEWTLPEPEGRNREELPPGTQETGARDREGDKGIEHE